MSLLSNIPHETTTHLFVDLVNFFMISFFAYSTHQDHPKEQIQISRLFELIWIDNDTESQAFYLDMRQSISMLDECHDAF